MVVSISDSNVISRFEFRDYPESVFDLTLDNTNIQHSYHEVMRSLMMIMIMMMMMIIKSGGKKRRRRKLFA